MMAAIRAMVTCTVRTTACSDGQRALVGGCQGVISSLAQIDA